MCCRLSIVDRHHKFLFKRGLSLIFLCFCFLVASRESRDLRIREGKATPHTINRTFHNCHIDFSPPSPQFCACCLYRHFMKNYQELEGEKIGGGGTKLCFGEKLQLKTLLSIISRARPRSRQTTSWCTSASLKHLLQPEQRRFGCKRNITRVSPPVTRVETLWRNPAPTHSSNLT